MRIYAIIIICGVSLFVHKIGKNRRKYAKRKMASDFFLLLVQLSFTFFFVSMVNWEKQIKIIIWWLVCEFQLRDKHSHLKLTPSRFFVIFLCLSYKTQSTLLHIFCSYSWIVIKKNISLIASIAGKPDEQIEQKQMNTIYVASHNRIFWIIRLELANGYVFLLFTLVRSLFAS